MQICPNCGEENPERFRLCGFCGTALAAPDVAQEVRKTVTIVFSDLKGSTKLGEALDSESLREVMTRYFDEMRTILEHHGGTVEKYIGDAIMAVFGLPRVREDDALRAVRAAHDMQRALAALNEELLQRWGVQLENRTGVNTGEVVAGDPTTGQRLVTGDTVNVAARLEQAAPALEVLIGATTHRLTRDAITVEAIEPLELKGKAERVPAFRLLSVTSERDAVLRQHDAPMVGRERELAELVDAYNRALADSRCQTATLIGDAGVGKSRLAEEFLRRVGGSAMTLRGRCVPYGDGITFWPIVELVREAAAISDQDQAEAARRKLDTLVGSGHEDVAERVASAIGLAESQFAVQELFWGVRTLLELLAERHPLVVQFEDLHWAEATFLDLVEHLTENLEGPVLLLCDARPTLLEQRPTWSAEANAVSFELAPLTPEQSERVVENLLGEAGLDADARDRIIEIAQGNPLFVEQLLSMLIDDGLVQFVDGTWRAGRDVGDVAIPPTIQALLAARLDGLEREERAVIEPAAVVGYVFAEGAVRELAPDDVRERVPQHLAALNRKQFVRPDPTERSFEDAYRFQHVLIRETAYDSLLKRARASLHERFVGWADRVNGDRAVEYEEILGYHLEQAHDYLAELGPLDDHGHALGDDGARRLASAGRRALARGDKPAAASLLERAARLLREHDPRRLELLPELGEALIDLGRFSDADAVLAEAVEIARAKGEQRLKADARLTQLLLEMRTGDAEGWNDVAIPEIQEAIEIFSRLADDGGLAKAYRLLGYVHGTVCNYGEAAQACERALEHARKAGDGKEQRISATSYALALCWGPTPVSEAIARCERILDDVAENRLSHGWVLCVLAHLTAMEGRFDDARRLYLDGRGAMEQVAQGWFVAWTSLSGSRVEMLAGDHVAAERTLVVAAESLEAMGERYLRPTVTALLCRALYNQGRLAEAEALTLEVEAMASPDDVETQAAWRSVRAQVYAGTGRHAEAATLAQDALQLVLPTDFEVMKIETLTDLGNVFGLIGDPGAAWPLEEALRLADAKGNTAAAEEIRNSLRRLKPQPAPASRVSGSL